MSRVVEPLAALAGAHAFRLGGSAVDAAIATAFAQAVVSPAMTTIAGNGSLIAFHAPTGRRVVLDFMGYAGARASADMYERASAGAHVRGYGAVLVPTFVRGTHAAFEQPGSGRVPWCALLEPAIRFADVLAARGLGFREDSYGGRVCLIAVDPVTGRATGASDPRGAGGLAEL